ncbi:restriction endonuclease subunit S [Streptomyces sp. F63]|uniref:restriction endonuclease subunit S n=1 Tax=Streptomyces sp. F63 TaxID=2824887 RepID=UPI001B39A8BE|nr:restriction endonuclease subunit S [Streptomyces sp. F63]MBQ0983735.1 restriction endonuclease subunit S [Streptomyces sp. F63]
MCTAIVDCEHKTAPEAIPGAEYGYSVGTPHIRNGRILLDAAKRIDKETYLRWTARAVPRDDDLILAREAPVGQVGRVANGQKICLGQRTVLLRPEITRVDPRYLHYLLLSPAVQEDMASKAAGSTVPHLNVKEIRELPLPPLPPMAYQAAVAATIGAMDDKIAINERIAFTADKLAAALFQGCSERSPYLITDVASITMGQSPPGETYNESEYGLPFYQGTRDFGMRHPRHRVWCTAVTRYAHANDVLVSVRAPVGEINVATEDCGIGRGLAAVRSEKYPHVLLHALSSDNSVWRPYETNGTVFGSINKKQFSQLKLSWPSEQRIDELESQLKALDDCLRQATEESRALAALRDTLLPQLMSGRLRVRDAEKIVEDHV